MSKKKNLGQYFTISDQLQQFVFEKVKYKSSQLLEPSFGAGHLLQKFKEYNENYPMVCCEIDKFIKHVVNFNEYQSVLYGDFTEQKLDVKFKTIIGNPPYVKGCKGKFNLYIKFIELCYDYLEENGEMVFIVPSDFIKLTSSSNLITKMTQTGSFTDFLFPNNEKLFKEANIDVLVFRYEKGLKGSIGATCTSSHEMKTLQRCSIGATCTTTVNEKEMIINVNDGIITFTDSPINGDYFNKHFEIYVGLVSGKDSVYCVDFGNTPILIDQKTTKKYIFTQTFPTTDNKINEHLEANKKELMARKIKKFTEKNWFEWGAPRNISHLKNNLNKPCIYIKNLTRSKEIAFIDQVMYFGGSLLCCIPKNENVNLDLIKDYLNSDLFQTNYIYSGRFKIGHKQISNAIIPNEYI